MAAFQVFTEGEGPAGFAICWTLSLVESMAVSFITFALIELPFLRMRERSLGRTKADELLPKATPAVA